MIITWSVAAYLDIYHSTYSKDHDTIFAAYGFRGHRQPRDLVNVTQNLTLDMLLVLNKREADCLFFKTVVHGKPTSPHASDLYIHDLFFSLSRIASRVAAIDFAPAVCPNSTQFLCGGQNRLVVPPEYFNFMGLYVHEWGIDLSPDEWSWSELVDLAGNAFDGHSLLTAALLLFIQAGRCV